MEGFQDPIVGENVWDEGYGEYRNVVRRGGVKSERVRSLRRGNYIGKLQGESHIARFIKY